MALALFDLDNTLIAGDSDHAWGDFLVANNIVDSSHYKQTNDQFYQDYTQGKLDIQAYLRFALRVLTQHSMSQLQQWRGQFLKEYIEPIILPQALDLIEKHKKRGDVCLIITATNDFVTAPIAQRFGINDLIATTAEKNNNRYTGEITGIPCYQEGKVTRLQAWLKKNNRSLKESYFYSDSHNDIPLLEQVSHPFAVDADPQLIAHAKQKNWPCISLR